jgi:UDP-N-acetyl-D-glucosamine/UDP-N-acetyl-D-galactosamine dehydrogenase
MHNKILPAIIGLGYVGLPLFLKVQKKYQSVGFDINKKRIDQLKKNKRDINSEFKKTELKLFNKSQFTSYESLLKKCNFFIIAVPTPIKKNKTPDLEPMRRACKIISKYLKKGDIVFFESTVYPGASKKLALQYFNKNNFKINKDLWLGYSPERINPGDKKHTIKKINKIVGFENCPNLIKKKIFSIYKLVSKKIIRTNSLEHAEMSKVIENIQRDINIAFMNEIFMVCDKLKLDFFEVIRLAKSKWNFLNFSPGLVGGHCLPVDPFYLYYLSKLKGHDANFMLAGRYVNNQLQKFLEKSIIKKIAKAKAKKILVCGTTYKANVPDIRNSLSLNIYLNIKKRKNLNVDAYDPIIDEITKKKYKIKRTVKNLSNYDLIIVLVKHKSYLEVLKKHKKKMPTKYLDIFRYIS